MLERGSLGCRGQLDVVDGTAGLGAVQLVAAGEGRSVAGQAGPGTRPQWQPQVQPGALQVLHEAVHHGLGVMRGRGYPQLLLAPRHGGVVDGLDVVAVLLEEQLGEVGAEDGVAHVDRDDVRRSLLHPDPSGKERPPEVLHVELVLSSQLPEEKCFIPRSRVSRSCPHLPSPLLRILTDARDPASTVGGRDVVKMKPWMEYNVLHCQLLLYIPAP